MNRRRLILAAAAVVLVVVTIVAAATSAVFFRIMLGLLAVGALVLLVDNRSTLSARVFRASRQVEQHLGAKPASRPAPAPEAPVDDSTDVRLIRASLVFDQEWYEAQTGRTFDGIEAAIRHYLRHGRRAGMSPHPLFVPSWLRPDDWTGTTDPLLSYLREENELWDTAPSPLFDPGLLGRDLSWGAYGPLSAFLRNRGAAAPLPYSADATGLRAGLTLDDVRGLLMERAREWRAHEDALAPARGTATAPDLSEELIRALREFGDRAPDARPLVSILLATRDRADRLRDAIDAVRAQTYENWELIVADDGSLDDTALVLDAETERDDRVRAVSLPRRGRGAARNAALAEAGGDYLAFLDDQTVWEPDFLLAMLAALDGSGSDAGYAMTQITRDGEPVYLSVAATTASLRVRGTIPLPAVVLRRALLDDGLAFADGEGSADGFVLALSRITALEPVPYMGVVAPDADPLGLDDARGRTANAATREGHAWRAAPLPDVEPGLVSVVIDDVAGASDALAALCDAVAFAGDVPAEYLLVARSNAWREVQTLALAELHGADVRIVLGPAGSTRAQRVNAALRQARGEFVYVSAAGIRHRRGSLADLLPGLEGSAAVHPLVVDAKRLISDAGVVYPEHGADPVGLLAGLPEDWPSWGAGPLVVPGATVPLLARTSDVREAQGFEPRLDRLWLDVDLSQRLAQNADRPVIVLPDVTAQAVAASPYGREGASAADAVAFRELWPAPPAGSRAALDAAGVDAAFDGFAAASLPEDPQRWTRAVWTPAAGTTSERPLRWSIKTAAPADDRADSWGDFHFAQSLAAALRAEGQGASIDYAPNADRATAAADDVVVTLRGLRPVPLPADATNLIWVISHPDQLTAAELAAYDLRYAASVAWSDRVSQRWGVGVDPLLQCTDPDRFFLDDERVDEVAGKLLMVGNSRRTYRPAAWHTAQAGLPLAIYGSDWEEFVDASAIAGPFVPNDQLRRYYRSADWALNDHWPDMREEGFISNRVFDVLASGGRLLTDRVDGLDTLIPSGVLPRGIASYASPADLLAVAQAGPDAFYDDASLAAASEHVRAEHSFAARARQMIDDVRRHRAQAPR